MLIYIIVGYTSTFAEVCLNRFHVAAIQEIQDELQATNAEIALSLSLFLSVIFLGFFSAELPIRCLLGAAGLAASLCRWDGQMKRGNERINHVLVVCSIY